MKYKHAAHKKTPKYIHRPTQTVHHAVIAINQLCSVHSFHVSLSDKLIAY